MMLFLSVVVLIGFVAFWIWDDHRNRKHWDRVSELLYRGALIREEHERLKRDHLETSHE